MSSLPGARDNILTNSGCCLLKAVHSGALDLKRYELILWWLRVSQIEFLNIYKAATCIKNHCLIPSIIFLARS